MLLDVRRWLGFTRVDEAERAIMRQEGDKVQQGDVIAETGGMFSRIVRAPVDGQDGHHFGRAGAAAGGKPALQVLAGIPGW